MKGAFSDGTLTLNREVGNINIEGMESSIGIDNVSADLHGTSISFYNIPINFISSGTTDDNVYIPEPYVLSDEYYNFTYDQELPSMDLCYNPVLKKFGYCKRLLSKCC